MDNAALVYTIAYIPGCDQGGIRDFEVLLTGEYSSERLNIYPEDCFNEGFVMMPVFTNLWTALPETCYRVAGRAASADLESFTVK